MRGAAMTAVLTFCGLLILMNALPLRAAHAASYCPNPAHARPEKVPADLIPALAAAFNVDKDAVRNGGVVRCVRGKLMGCFVGANLNCDKADMRRSSFGAAAWCRSHPGAADIPMAATGHDTIYAWSCKGSHAVPGKAVVKVDRQGYVAQNWKEIH
ncbi:MAG TPA: hypothetical protein VIJ04_01220 [Xanthobacteraceae bacterium]